MEGSYEDKWIIIFYWPCSIKHEILIRWSFYSNKIYKLRIITKLFGTEVKDDCVSEAAGCFPKCEQYPMYEKLKKEDFWQNDKNFKLVFVKSVRTSGMPAWSLNHFEFAIETNKNKLI